MQLFAIVRIAIMCIPFCAISTLLLIFLCWLKNKLVQVGSADHHIHYYDLRNISQPLHVFTGHKKAVSYVKFLTNNELASASTDSTLRLWDVKENLPVSKSCFSQNYHFDYPFIT